MIEDVDSDCESEDSQSVTLIEEVDYDIESDRSDPEEVEEQYGDSEEECSSLRNILSKEEPWRGAAMTTLRPLWQTWAALGRLAQSM